MQFDRRCPFTCTPAIQPMPYRLPEGYVSVRAPQETSQEGLTRNPSQRREGLRDVNKGCRQPGLARQGLSQTQVREGYGGEFPRKEQDLWVRGERKNTATAPPARRGLDRKWPVLAQLSCCAPHWLCPPGAQPGHGSLLMQSTEVSLLRPRASSRKVGMKADKVEGQSRPSQAWNPSLIPTKGHMVGSDSHLLSLPVTAFHLALGGSSPGYPSPPHSMHFSISMYLSPIPVSG